MNPLLKIKNTTILLITIMIIAAAVRLYKLTESPPGLNQDEAITAWSAYCLLKTGKDNAGQPWPIYYMRGLGGNNPVLSSYITIPFQAIGGLNIHTTRLPAAAGGIFTVWLIYWIGKRLFNIDTGIAAAFLMALSPWHIMQSRWGHEASITPLLGLLPVAGMLWSNLPVSDDSAPPRPVAAAISGILAGIGCYGYQAVRLFVPVFIFALILFNLPGWWKTLKTKKGLLAISLFIFCFTAVWGQLAYLHIFHPEGISKHALYQANWIGSMPVIEYLKNMPGHYFKHYSIDFLFRESDIFLFQGPPVGGQCHWYELPLMIVGICVILKKFWRSASIRTVAAFVLAFPAGDGFVLGTLSTLRSTCGLAATTLLAAVGLVAAIKWLEKRKNVITRLVIITFLLTAIGFNVRFLFHLFGEYNRRENVYYLYHADLVEACKWLKPRFDDFEAVYITADNFNMPYVVTAVVLGYDPDRWFSEPREFYTPGEWDVYTRYGKMHFVEDFSDFSMSELQNKFAPKKVLIIIRPQEVALNKLLEKLKGLENLPDQSAMQKLVESIDPDNPDKSLIREYEEKVVHKIYDPDGKEALWICII